MSEFGKGLLKFRENTIDPANLGRKLSQKRLGALVGEQLGIDGYSGATICNWEKGTATIDFKDRTVLLILFRVLFEYGGIKNLSDVNGLLAVGNYRALNDDEATSINPNWILPKLTNIKSTSGKPSLSPKLPFSNEQTLATEVFVVGRTKEVEKFGNLLKVSARNKLLNIYGPGGIGKTIVGRKMYAYAKKNQIPFSFVQGNQPDLTPPLILYTIKEGLSQTEALVPVFSGFEREYDDYLLIQQILHGSGGIQTLFDTIGSIKDPTWLEQTIHTVGKNVSESAQHHLGNRFALERYLRGVEKALAARLAENITAGLEQIRKPAVVLFDTYEDMEAFDEWVCQITPLLPHNLKMVILGRNALANINFDWSELEDKLTSMELEELPEEDAKAYLRHFGLHDPIALDQVFRYTGGYPLLMVLVRWLVQEAGGWDKIGVLENNLSSRDQIATHLLERILSEGRVVEVQAFLEKGVIARWFNPEIIGLLLEINISDARKIYDKLRRHSFVEKHQYGLKFHDKIRELLKDRLKFTSRSEYDKLSNKLTQYYAEQAGLENDDLGSQITA